MLLDCWTYHTPKGDFLIKENDQQRYVAYFEDVPLLGGSFWRAGQALEELCGEFPGLPDDTAEWEYTPVEF